jgi:NodT family efflux transporter outer membrane factor (OMF) lipoprotein
MTLPGVAPVNAADTNTAERTNMWAVAQPSDGQIKGRWWEIFGDPQLNQLEEQVAISNQSVIASLQNFLAARAVARQARTAYFPTVTVDPLATRSHNSRGATSGLTVGNTGSATTGGGAGTATSTTSSSGTSSFFELPADASWEPDLWGSIRNTVRENAYAAQASAAQLENLKLSLQSELASDYYQLRAQDEVIEVYSNTVKSYRDSLELTKTLAETGIDSELDVAQADSLLETTLAQASAVGVPRAQLEHAIAMLVGKPPAEFALAAMPLRARPPEIPVALPSQLLQRRPDISAAERAVAEANAAIGVARAAYFPTITLTGNAGFQNSSIGSLLNASSFYWTLGGELSETVFDAGRRKAVTQQAWALYRAAVASYRQTTLNAFQQIEDNLAALRILAAEAAQQEIAIRAAQKNLDLSMERYRLGINSYLNVITAQITLLQNQQAAVSIQSQQMTSAVQLVTALGGGWNESDLVAVKRVLRGKPPGPADVLGP